MGKIINLKDYFSSQKTKNKFEFTNPDRPVQEWEARDFYEIYTMLRQTFPDDPEYAWEVIYLFIQIRAKERSSNINLSTELRLPYIKDCDYEDKD